MNTIIQDNSQCRPIVIVIGPTGVGKSSLAESLGRLLPIHIVNGDMAQLYEPLTIGTAKPDWRASTIPHHLFDILNAPESTNALRYRQWVLEVLTKDCKENIPVVVGGSTLYIMSLFFSLNLSTHETSSNENAELASTAHLENAQLWNLLKTIDPIRAAKIHPNDYYRLRRALAVWYSYGIKPSEFTLRYNPIGSIFLLHLDKERMVLKKDLKHRIEAMLLSGWLEEVEALLKTPWKKFWEDKRIIGYSHLASHLEQGSPWDELTKVVQQITQETVDYAKKQATFWRMLVRKINEARIVNSSSACLFHYEYQDLTFPPPDLYLEQLCLKINSFIKDVHAIRKD